MKKFVESCLQLVLQIAHMSATPIKATRKKAPRLPVPPSAPALVKTNLALTPATLESLRWLKAKGYSYAFAIELGVQKLRQSVENPGRGL